MCLVNVIHGCIVKVSLCFVPVKSTLNCADYTGEKSVVIVSHTANPTHVHIKDDTVFYTRISSR